MNEEELELTGGTHLELVVVITIPSRSNGVGVDLLL